MPVVDCIHCQLSCHRHLISAGSNKGQQSTNPTSRPGRTVHPSPHEEALTIKSTSCRSGTHQSLHKTTVNECHLVLQQIRPLPEHQWEMPSCQHDTTPTDMTQPQGASFSLTATANPCKQPTPLAASSSVQQASRRRRLATERIHCCDVRMEEGLLQTDG